MSTQAAAVTLMQFAVLDPVLDQGQEGSCVENAMSATLSLQMQIAGAPIEPISRQQSYTDARISQHMFGYDSGSSVVGTFSQAMTKGLASEASWSYGPDHMYVVPPQSVYDEAAQHKVLSWSNINVYQNYTGLQHTIKALLDQGKPVMLEIAVPKYLFYETGPLASQDHTDIGTEASVHLITIVGADDSLPGVDPHSGSFIVKNSWGSNWGDGGYGTIAYATFASASVIGGYTFNGFNGIDLTYSASRVQVNAEYAFLLHRPGDITGVDWWGTLQLSPTQLADAFISSSEGILSYGAENNSQFVESMYATLVGRHSDPGGMAFYTAQLDGGLSRGGLFNEIFNVLTDPKSEATAHDRLVNTENVANYITIAMQYKGDHNTAAIHDLALITSDANQMEIVKVGIPHDFGMA